MTVYQETILHIVRLIPAGKVASYSQVAAYAGTPRAARQVGWTLRSLESTPDFPWWRVINNAGIITIKGNHLNDAELQKSLLESEGMEVSPEFKLSMAEYRFRPTADVLATINLDPAYIINVLAKYSIE